MSATTCPRGHPIRSSADRDTHHYCRACKRAGDRRRNSRRSAAMEFALALEGHGVPITRSGIDLQWLAADIARRLES